MQDGVFYPNILAMLAGFLQADVLHYVLMGSCVLNITVQLHLYVSDAYYTDNCWKFYNLRIFFCP